MYTVSPNNTVLVDPDRTVDNGGSIMFTCNASGGPNNMFVWVRTDNITDVDTQLSAENSITPIDVNSFLGNISNAILVNDSVLSLNNITGAMDGGSYTCLVINEAGVGRQETILYVRPMITQQPMDTIANNGTMVTLTCIADSFTAPEYQWEFMNRTTEQFETIEGETSTELSFSMIAYEEYGMYQCVVFAEVVDEDGMTMITVNVTSEPALITGMCERYFICLHTVLILL